MVGDEPTMQSPDECWTVDTEALDQSGDIVSHRRRVVTALRTIAVPPSSQIGNQHLPVKGQLLRQMAHAFAALKHPVQQDNGWVLGVRWIGPVTIRQTNAIDLLEAGAGLTHWPLPAR
jgi:hypothetical protein